ncbi:hypothetical protein MATL_G00257250 [Megalops atlanticus]|uniref:Tyrosinase n=1 Tax=Megalops atlanticus TaxID=7932 RepID=A0A9D3PBP1_MEGAT|nr:hypothetical protein MATL_G00257250 [Megalops atlanticus]
MVQPRSVLPLLLLLLLAVTEAHIPRVCTTQQYRSLKRCCPDFEGSPCRAAAVGGKNAAHQGPTFPFWHRYYLLFMEREIRDLTGDEDFFIPYWDWTKTNHCNICTNDLMGDSPGGNISQESGFSRWQTVCTYDDEITSHAGYRKICAKPENDADIKYIQRSPGKNSESNALPTAEEVKMVLATEEYDTPPYNRRSENSFRNRLEGFDLSVNSKNLSDAMHNLVHDYLNGTVSQVPIAANDPIFMLHHAMIDKIFEEWLLKHPNMTYPISEEITPIQRADSLMRPFFPPVRNDHLVGYTAEELGYKYE